MESSPTQNYSIDVQRLIQVSLNRLHNDGLGYAFGEWGQFMYRQQNGNSFPEEFHGRIDFWSKAPVTHVMNVLKNMGFNVQVCQEWRKVHNDNGLLAAEYIIYEVTFNNSYSETRKFQIRIFTPHYAKDPWEFVKDLDVNKVFWDRKNKAWVNSPSVDSQSFTWQINSHYRLECDYETPDEHIQAMVQYGISRTDIARRPWLDKDNEKPHTTDNKETKSKGNIMATTEQDTALSFAKECLHDGMWRSVGDNTVTHAKDVICNVLRSKGADDSTMTFIGDLLDSKEGEAAVAGFLAALLHFGPQYMPMIPESIKNDPRVKRLAKEYGTKATSEGMTLVYKELLAIALPVFAQLAKDLQSLPPVEHTRIETETTEAIETEETEETAVSRSRKTA